MGFIMANKSLLSKLPLLVFCIIVGRILILCMLVMLSHHRFKGKQWITMEEAVMPINSNGNLIIKASNFCIFQPVILEEAKLPEIKNRYYQRYLAFAEGHKNSVIQKKTLKSSYCYSYHLCVPVKYDTCYLVPEGTYTFEECFKVCESKNCSYFDAPDMSPLLDVIKNNFSEDFSFWLGLVKFQGADKWSGFYNTSVYYNVTDLQDTFCSYTSKNDPLIRTDVSCVTYRRCLCLSQVSSRMDGFFRMIISNVTYNYTVNGNVEGIMRIDHTPLSMEAKKSFFEKYQAEYNNKILQAMAVFNSSIQFLYNMPESAK
ncbi:BZLF2-like protein [Phascolarctid gammaherpesvirus 1]|uniref:BZLF2-like protein n=1 Tax=Phascolarctid gammaherpesvirus 1 TaxID=2249313 RepID=A0A3Q8J8F6_9GAMA|nr:BZLF2-like protein [Phascolarctid gammaherpesvirus 1]AZB49222.1 BZLF2-like protein [Phascolarctid gammaherpesvirus 1]